MGFPGFSRRAARLTTLLALTTLANLSGCSTNDLRGDDVSADPKRPDKMVDPFPEQQYRDELARQEQLRWNTAASAKSTGKPK